MTLHNDNVPVHVCVLSDYSGFAISSPDWRLRIALDYVSKVLE